MGLMSGKEVQTTEKAQEQYEQLLEIIQTEFHEERRDALLKMYEDYRERVMTAPASGKVNFHNAFEGGYIDHILRVIEISRYMHKFYVKMGGWADYTEEELIFSAMHHDLGKLGTLDEPYYVPQTSDWHRKNKMEVYTQNEQRQYMKTCDMTMFILQSYGVAVTQKEMLGMKLTDGLYDEGNKSYLIQYGAGPLPMQTSLHKILHWADHMAATVENDQFRKVWLKKVD